MNTSGIVPVDVKVLVKPKPVEEKTAGGIIRPDIVRDKEKYATTDCEVIAVGDNAFQEWGDAATKPKEGDIVVTAQYAGLNKRGADECDYRIVNDEDIIAVLEAKP